jgi:hypothetical protein
MVMPENTVEQSQQVELSASERVLRGLGGLSCMVGGILAIKYLPYSPHDSMDPTAAFTAGSEIAGTMLLYTAARGRTTSSTE